MNQTESPLRNRPAAHPATAESGKNLITIASGKGGVGKTVLAVSLSHALAKLGNKVLLFDGDVGLANVDIQLGLMPQMDLATVMTGGKSLADVVFRYPEGGFDIIAGRSSSGVLGTMAAAQLKRLHQDLVEVGAAYDYVILDLGAGIDEAVRTLSAGSGPKLVVTTGDPTSLTDAYAYIKVMTQRSQHGNIQVLVNMAKSKAEGQKIYDNLLKACRNFLHIEPPLAGIIEMDDKVAGAIRAQTGLMTRYPTSTAANNVEDLAKTIMKGAA
ncbi:MAG: cobyrinic acid a,c-diamide synthase [Sneathiella sp.]|nr:MAG: cobyrinic acid a,c-diamide synthase [Sneathiella sp.]